MLLTGLAGALLGVAITAVSPLQVHLGRLVIEGPGRFAVAAAGGALCAIVLRWALRAERGR